MQRMEGRGVNREPNGHQDTKKTIILKPLSKIYLIRMYYGIMLLCLR